MKKTLILLCIASLGAATMTSCKKSSKGKLTGDWTVASYDFSGTDTDANGTSSWSQVSDGATVTSSYTSGGVTTSSSKSETITYSIVKDGTYSTETTTIETTPDTWGGTTYGNTVSTTVSHSSGTWSFVKKNKAAEVKTNERVVFNETASDYTSTDVYTPTTDGTNVGLTSSTDTNSGSSADDANYMGSSEMYVISESKKKELIFTMENSSTDSNSSTSGGTTTTTTSSSTMSGTMTLTQE